jgi:predicted glycosyltransferase
LVDIIILPTVVTNLWPWAFSMNILTDALPRFPTEEIAAQLLTLPDDADVRFDKGIEGIGIGRSGGEPPVRTLLYSHDTFGLGHLSRNLAIAEHLLQRPRRFEVMLLSGSPVADSWPLPRDLQLSAMPPVVKVGAEEYAARNGAVSFDEVKGQREAIIIETIRDYRPDVLVVDHAPAGMKGELLGALALLCDEMPTTKKILGLRDILDDGRTVRSLWQEQGIYDLIRHSYDQILVYGSPSLFDVVKEYDLSDEIADKLRYCGHVARCRPMATNNGTSNTEATVKTVLVTVGGGGDGYPIIDAYLRCLDRLAVAPEQSIIVTGPLMTADQQRKLEAEATRRDNVRITRSTTDMSTLLSEADLIVSMAGYNSTVEVLAAQKPAILVPRAAPRMEQRLRAELLAELGLVWVVRPDEDAAARLAEFLNLALSGARPSGLGLSPVDLGGARRVGDAVEALLEAESSAIVLE